MMSNRSTIIPACCFLLAIIIALMSRTQQHETDTGKKERTPHDQPSDSSSPKWDPATARSSMRTTRKMTSSVEPTHHYAQLNDFVIPELKLDQMTFPQALNELRNQYYAVCQQTGEIPIRFKFKINDPNSNPVSRPLSLTINNKSMLSMLRILNAIAGVEMTRKDQLFTFTQLKSEGPQLTRTLSISPDMPNDLGLKSPTDETDPFAADAEDPELRPPTNISPQLIKFLNLTDSSISHLSLRSKLVIRATPQNIDRIETLIKELQPSHTQINVSSRIITIPESEEAAPLPKFVSKSQAQKMLRDFMQQKGTSTFIAPSIVTRPQQKATVESIREIITPTGQNSGLIRSDWAGVKISQTPTPMGFGTSMNLDFDVGEPVSGSSLDPIEVTHHKTKTEQFIKPGHVMIVPLKTNKGEKRYMFINSNEIQPPAALISP